MGGASQARGELVVASCRSAGAMARQVVQSLEELRSASGHPGPVRVMEEIDFSFSDAETGVRLQPGVEGRDVFLLQSLFNPGSGACVDRNYLALLIAARAFREWGAAHVTALAPYLAYARQDKPTPGMAEPTTAKLLADLSAVAGIDRLITWHPHCGQIRGFYAPIPVLAPDPLDFFVREFAAFQGREDAIAVAPDAGASKLVANFGRALGLRCAIATKHRPSRGQAAITELIGDFSGVRTAIVLDDMISSGGTLNELVRAIAGRTPIEEIRLAASHNLCRPGALELLRELHERHRLASVTVSDSIPQTPEFLGLPFFLVRPLAGRLSRIVHAVHGGLPTSEAQ